MQAQVFQSPRHHFDTSPKWLSNQNQQQRSQRRCRNGRGCRNTWCTFSHPPDSQQQQQQQQQQPVNQQPQHANHHQQQANLQQMNPQQLVNHGWQPTQVAPGYFAAPVQAVQAHGLEPQGSPARHDADEGAQHGRGARRGLNSQQRAQEERASGELRPSAAVFVPTGVCAPTQLQQPPPQQGMGWWSPNAQRQWTEAQCNVQPRFGMPALYGSPSFATIEQQQQQQVRSKPPLTPLEVPGHWGSECGDAADEEMTEWGPQSPSPASVLGADLMALLDENA